MKKMRNAHRNVVGKLLEKQPLGRQRRRWYWFRIVSSVSVGICVVQAMASVIKELYVMFSL
jgi:hypothetical protein